MKTPTPSRVAALSRTFLKSLLCGAAAAVWAMPGTANATLGNYPNTTVQLSGNATVVPDAAPFNTASINVSTSTNFKGRLEGNPGTGVVRVTDAHPAGTYTVTVTGFDIGGGTSTATFSLTVTTPVTCNPVTFAAPANLATPDAPRAVAIGDFNGDGKQDLATSLSPANVGVLLGNGMGSFGTVTNFGVGGLPESIAVGDFNGDGKQDLATANPGANSVSIVLGDGAGGFGAASNLGVGAVPRSVAVGDFNGDGRQDLAVANQLSDNVSIFLGKETGSFSAPTTYDTGTNPNSIAVGDFNGDGRQDLAIANRGPNIVSLLLGNGAGGFGTATTFPAGTAPEFIAMGDFNGDGNQDLAVANTDSNNVSVLLGDGAGSFGTTVNFATGTFPESVRVGDFNGDGQQDLVVANTGSDTASDTVSILLGNGAGAFSAATNFGVGSMPTSVVVGDFNGDGKQDLAVANFASNNVSVLLRQCPSATLGNYPNTTVQLSGNATVVPDAAPFNTASINVSTSTNFKGRLEGNPATGIVRVTDAHPAGTYTVTVTGFDIGGGTSTATFTLTVTTPATCNPVTFTAAANFGVGTDPRSATVGDFNGDGKQDLAVANVGASNVSVLLGNGQGSFGAATNFGVGNGPILVAVGDFNNDGKQDLAVANADSDSVSVLLGDGAGSFGAATNFGVGSQPRSVAVGDFNDDGKQDLAVANVNSNNVSVLLGNGAGSFGLVTNFGLGSESISVAIGDFNGDGHQDLAVAHTNSNNVSVLLGDGTGGFNAATHFGAGPTPFSVAVGDFNGDGQQDLVMPNLNTNTVSVLLGDGAGGFGVASNFGVGSAPVSVTVGDFNGDGTQDLAVANANSNNLSVLLCDGTGSFSAGANFDVGTNPYRVAVGDFNGDGKQDLVTANTVSNNVSVLLRQCVATTPTPTPTPTPSPTPTPCNATFSENFDGVTAPALPGGWTSAATGVLVRWVTSTTNPASAPNDAFAPDRDNKGTAELVTPAIALPADGGILTFQNLFNMQAGFDGMVLEISINGGGVFADILTAGGSFATGGYTHVISAGFGNPIAGRMAWSGLSGGTTAAPTYTTTTVNLPAAANGQNIRLKWRAATDTNTAAEGAGGVRIDNIGIVPASCGAPPPTPTAPPTATPGVTPLPTATPGASGTPMPAPTPTPTPPPGSGVIGVALVEVYDLDSGASSRLANISTRAFVSTGDDVVIAGFILGNGGGDTNVIIRGLGPSLSAFGVPTVLANPTLDMRNADGTLVFTNNDWQDNPTQAAIIAAAGLAPSNALEAAIAATLPPGFYTALLAGLNKGTGNGLVEVYDLGDGTPFPTPTPGISPTPVPSPTSTPGVSPTPIPGGPSPAQAVNFSTRMFVRTGDGVGIGGFIITGSAPKQVLVRAIGPSLSRFGIADFLADPVLELSGSNGFTTVINNNWRDTQEQEIQDTGIPPTNDLESAIVVTMAPGAYTAIVRGQPAGTPASSPTPSPASSPSPTPAFSPSPTPAASPTPSPAGVCVENFDGGSSLPAGWVATNDQGPPPLWAISTVNPDTPPNDAFVSDTSVISDKRLDTRPIVIGGGPAQLTFRNFYDFEYDPPPAEVFWDGGVLEVSINGGPFLDIIDPAIGGSFVSGGYNGVIDDSANNPIAAQQAWGANTAGLYINSVVNLGPNVVGQTIVLRFRMGTDEAIGAPGWRIDTFALTGGACP